MKKTTAVLISLFIILSLAACGNSESGAEASPAEENSVETTADDADGVSDASDADSANDADGEDDVNGASDADDVNNANGVGDSDDAEASGRQGSKVLVAYFSATNTTKGVAENIAKGLDADIYEIVPEEPYTDADLDYNDDNSRTTIEMNDPDARPAISGSVSGMEQYDIVFIGYPIWWGEAPRIISTFVESYDFSGKTIVPFCTSGGSGISASVENLEELAGGAQWLSGQRLNGGDSQDTVMEWVNGLGLDL